MNTKILSPGHFPSLTSNRVEWAAVYLEPVMGSGERITIGVVFHDSKGLRFEQTLQKQQLKCLFGDVAHKIKGLIDTIQGHVVSQENIAALKLPFFGASIGHVHRVAANVAEDVMETSMSMSSAFIALPEYGNEDEDEDELDVKDEVRETVVKRVPQLKDYFNISVKLIKNSRKVNFSFIGMRSAINLAKVNPGNNFSTYVDKAKARILDLSSLRQYDLSHPVEVAGNTGRQDYDLIVFYPGDDSPLHNKQTKSNVRSALNLLEDEADKSDVRLIPMIKAQEAADWIVKREVARG